MVPVKEPVKGVKFIALHWASESKKSQVLNLIFRQYRYFVESINIGVSAAQHLLNAPKKTYIFASIEINKSPLQLEPQKA